MNQRRLTHRRSGDLDSAIFILFKNTRSNNIPITRSIIKEKVLSFEQTLKLTSLKRSQSGSWRSAIKAQCKAENCCWSRKRRYRRNDCKLEGNIFTLSRLRFKRYF